MSSKQIVKFGVGWENLCFMADKKVITEFLKILNSGVIFSAYKGDPYYEVNKHGLNVTITEETIEEELIGISQLFPEWSQKDRDTAAKTLYESYLLKERDKLSGDFNAYTSPE